ncbi:MAG: 4-hydroxythreonine-4-phosphate dehydrogenase PdxA [Deltaproteobacteria bacterium]|nr:4-hydroxythreonine-4-phosphate dehydrogenase PdxA [Deltaproteobacteria bacterium]
MSSSKPSSIKPVLAFTQGDPSGIGPEILLKLMQESPADPGYHPLLVAERSALEVLRGSLPEAPWERLEFHSAVPSRESLRAGNSLAGRESIHVLDPIARRRELVLGQSSPADAAGAIAALDAGVAAVQCGAADALVTAPVSKESIARQHLPNFVGHTEYLAAGSGLERYGRDYLMAFLAPDLQVALLSTHLPLVDAVAHVSTASVLEALLCLGSHAGGRIALAGLNPHAGEGGLLGLEDARELEPAVAAARQQGLDVHGPVSADSLFARARQGEFDWVLSLYHDQGLIAVKTAAFGTATNWTLGLPYLRTSVDHGTAFGIAGQGVADVKPLQAVVETTLQLLTGHSPRGRRGELEAR